jgi:hypothetical protein
MNAETYVGLFAATLRRMIAQSGEVAKQAAPAINNGTYNADAWTKSAIQLMDIAALGVVEMAENAMAGPSAPAAPRFVKSDRFSAPDPPAAPDPIANRVLSWETRLSRVGTVDYLPDDIVAFLSPKNTDETLYPPGTLPPTATGFRFAVDTVDLPGGLYTGKVRVRPVHGNPSGQTVAVYIEL